MSTQRYVSTSFWDDEWIQSLSYPEKLLYLYLMTNPLTNIAGVYKLSIRRMVFDTGMDEKSIQEIFKKFEESGKAFRMDEFIVLPSWPKHQKWEKAPKIKEGIIACLKELGEEYLKRLVSMKYRFDIRIVLDTLSIPHNRVFSVDPNSKYPSNYSDPDPDINSDPDPDSDPDINSDPPVLYNFNPGLDDFSKRVDTLGKNWNDLKIGPPFKKMLINLSPPELHEISGSLKTYPDDVSIGAMRNYQKVRNDPLYDPGECVYKSFIGFMVRGVEKYCDEAMPFEIFKKKGQPPAQPNKKGLGGLEL